MNNWIKATLLVLGAVGVIGIWALSYLIWEFFPVAIGGFLILFIITYGVKIHLDLGR